VYTGEVNLTQRLQNASDLGVLQSIITNMRSPEPTLSSDQAAFMQGVLWPWWSWMMRRCDGRGRLDSPFLDIMTKEADFIQANRDRLNRLCEALWGEGVTSPEDKQLVLELVLKLRSECLMRSSSTHCH